MKLYENWVGASGESGAIWTPSDPHCLPQNPQQSSGIVRQIYTSQLRSEIFLLSHFYFCSDRNISDQRHDENILVDFVPPVSPGILPWRRDREGYWTDPILTIENNILQTLLRWIMRLRVIKISLISSVILVCTYGEQTWTVCLQYILCKN